MKALVLVDIQNDFLPGGALAVPHGDEIIPVVNRWQDHFDLVVATQDWHPPDHGSFAANHPHQQPGDRVDLNGIPQILWPIHCVQGTAGAQFAAALDQTRVAAVFQKGTDPEIDSYSGFFDNDHRSATGLERYLRQHRVTAVCVVGLATDYCVKFTALDARRLGFSTQVVRAACRGVERQPGDVQTAWDEMAAAGVEVVAEFSELF